ncbi:MAG: hypothetical protein ACLFNT_12965 [Spirochaetales bacterium]
MRKLLHSAARLARIGAFTTVFIILIIGCHPLINPVDPKSPAYGGTRTEPDAEREPSLPEITSWEIFAEHEISSGVFARIPLTIPESGLFTEPRRVDAITNMFEIEITFAEPVAEVDIEGGAFIVGFASTSFAMVHEVGSPDVGLIDGGKRLIYYFDLSSETPPYQLSLTMQLIDPNQVLLDERTVYFLTGDVNGDGVVDPLDANGVQSVNAVLGQIPDPRRPTSVRADIDLSGLVDDSATAPDTDDRDEVLTASGNTVANVVTLIM